MHCPHIFLLLGVFSLLSISAADPAIGISFDKTARADFGGAGTSQDVVAGLKDAIGMPARIIERKPKGKVLKNNPGQLLVEGLSGKALSVGIQPDGRNVSVFYRPDPPISSAAGAVSFWIKPETWNGDEKPNYHHFFSARNGNHWLFIYKYAKSTDLKVFYGTYKTNNQTVVSHSIRNWRKNEWHHIGVIWNAKALQLFVDGRQKNILPMKGLLPEDFNSVILGEYWKGDPGRTLIDEVRIFNQAITSADMAKEYARLADKLDRTKQPPVRFSVAKKTAETDGRIVAGEYPAVIGGMRNFLKKNTYAASQARCHFSWDTKYLYIGVSSPDDPAKRVAIQTGRDSDVFTDDSVELHVKTAEHAFQFAVNPLGAILDSRDGNASWNSAGIRTAGSFTDGRWNVEIKIPWQDLEIKPADGMKIRFNLARSYASLKEFTQLAPARRGYADAAGFAEMICVDKAPAYDISRLGDLSKNRLDCKLEISSSEKETARIKFAADASMFSVNIDRKFSLTPGRESVQAFKQSLPPENSLFVDLEIPGKMNLYQTQLDYAAPENLRKWYIYTDLAKAELVMVMRNRNLGSGRSAMHMQFVDPDGKAVKTMSVSLTDQEPVVEARFPLAGLPAGRYELCYTVQDASGKTFITDSEEYEYYKNGACWDGIRDGLERTVPAPWTPVSGKGAEFNCWGRRVLFGSGGMIASIRSQGKELLKRPVSLKVNGKAVSFQARCISADPVNVVFELKPADPKIPLTVKAVCEFDGFMYFTCSSPADSEIGTVALEIPLERKYADAFDDCASPHYKNSLKKDTVLNVNAFTNPFFWCGGDEVGMMGGTATKRGWYVKDKSRSMTVTAGKQEVLLTLRIADRPFRTGSEGNVFSFYLNPTPVKPLKKFTEPPRERGNIIIGGTSSRFFMYYHPDYGTDFWKWIRARVKQDKRIRPDKMTYFSYIAPKGVSPMSPAWNYYCTDWVNPPPGLGEYSSDQAHVGRTARNLNSFTYGCLNSKSFYDHQLMCVRNVLDGTKWKQDDVKHLYFDLCWPRSCGNVSHGCRWKDEFGDTVRDNDLLRLREYFIRVLRMVRRKSPDGWLWGHIYPSRTPSDNFFDLIVGGEMYDSKVYKQVSYYDVLDPELVRIAYGTRCVEMTTALIPQFLRSLECFAPARKKYWDPNDPKHDRAIRHFIAYTSLFGLIQCFDIWDRRQRLLPQGKGQVDIWHRYFETLGEKRTFRRLEKLVPGTDRVFGCIYTGNGNKMLIVLNDTDAEKELTAAVPWSGVSPMKDIFNGKNYPVKDKTVRLKLAPRDSVFLYQGKM